MVENARPSLLCLAADYNKYTDFNRVLPVKVYELKYNHWGQLYLILQKH
jgi:hypothetical protein